MFHLHLLLFLLPLQHTTKVIEVVFDERVVLIRPGGYRQFLVKWRNRPLDDCTWLSAEEFHRLDLDLFERYEVFTSSKTSFSQSGKVN